MRYALIVGGLLAGAPSFVPRDDRLDPPRGEGRVLDGARGPLRGARLAVSSIPRRQPPPRLPLSGPLAERTRIAGRLEAQVNRTLEAYGGEATLRNIVAVRETGSVASTARQGAVGTLVRLRARPGKLRVEIAYPNEKPERRVLDGGKGWRGGKEVRGPLLDAMVLQAARLDLPLLLADKRAELRDNGTEEHGGTKLRSLEIPLPGKMNLTVLIDPASGRIVHSGGHVPSPVGTLEFGSSYSDFRTVDGVLFAFRERTFAMGRHAGDTTLVKVELLRAPPKDAFVP